MTTISSSTTLTQSLVDSYTWPVTIQGGTSSSPVTITFGENITLNAATKYFIIGSNYVTINGNNKTLTINTTLYPGLVKNGTSIIKSGYSNITIQNITMACGVSTQTAVATGGNGWFCQIYYGNGATNNLLQNLSTNGAITDLGGIAGSFLASYNGSITVSGCSSSGAISGSTSITFGVGANTAGGIVGSYAGYTYGNVTISNCNSSGNISNSCGGICGSNAGYNYGTVTINGACYSTGTIGSGAGGICGVNTGFVYGTVNISGGCYSTGAISSFSAGGICGNSPAGQNGSVTIDGCYSTGNIGISSTAYGNNLSGGICGSYVGQYYGSCIIKNCYSTGIINDYMGGICGSSTGTAGGSCVITNCYSNGAISGIGAGGICGSHAAYVSGSCTITNCYSTGAIGSMSSYGAGGICGINCGFNSGNCTISNSYSTGAIVGAGCGGIVGSSAGYTNGIVNITNCYSTGVISYYSSGGICGAAAGDTNGTVTISNSYSTGNITGYYSGGIGGQTFGYRSNKLCSINNCYSIGNITGTSTGGIVGAVVGLSDYSVYTSNVLISNSYSFGTVSSGSGAICGGTGGSTYATTPIVKIQNCYGVSSPLVSTGLPITPTITNSGTGNGTWSDTTASYYLLGNPSSNPVGKNWTSISTNDPWLLTSFNASLYNPSSVTVDDSVNTYTSNAGLLTSVIYNSFYINTPALVTINSSNGILSFNQLINGSNIANVIAYKGTISGPSPSIYYGYNINSFSVIKELISGFNSNTKPFITQQPQAQFTKPGSQVIFYVNALSLTPITYQWYFNGNPIPNATSQYYIIPNAQIKDTGSYYVIVTNTAGSTQSSTVQLVVKNY